MPRVKAMGMTMITGRTSSATTPSVYSLSGRAARIREAVRASGSASRPSAISRPIMRPDAPRRRGASPASELRPASRSYT